MRRIHYILIVVLLTSFVGCSPRVIESVRTQVEYRDREVHDSVFVKDSVQEKIIERNDTVFIYKYKDKIVYKAKWVHDTTSIVQIDTLYVPKPVPAELTFIQKMQLKSYGFLLVAVLILGVWTFRKPLLKIIRKAVIHV